MAPPDKSRPLRLPWPRKGIDRAEPRADQPSLTCDDALNVDTFDDRERQGGGKRMGLINAFPLAPTVTGPVQSLVIYRISSALAGITPEDPLGPGPPPDDWTSLGTPPDGEIRALGRFPGNLTLIAAGEFANIGGVVAAKIASWSGTVWSTLSSGLATSLDIRGVKRLPRATIATDPELFIPSQYIGGGVSSRVSGWDGTAFRDISVADPSGTVGPICLAIHDEGSGKRLYAGGTFTTFGGITCNRIARYNPTADEWESMGPGPGFDAGQVNALVVFNDGSGDRLYAGGTFTQSNGVGTARVAVWTGSVWTQVGGGIGNGSVRDLVVFDGKLYAIGSFKGLGVSSNAISTREHRIAVYDPIAASWGPVGWGLRQSDSNSTASALAGFVYDDGTGEALFVTGQFTAAGNATGPGIATAGIAKWDGTVWTSPPRGFGVNVNANDQGAIIATGDPFTAIALYVGGSYLISNVRAFNRLATWDGSNWSAEGGAGVMDSVAMGGIESATISPDVSAALYVGISSVINPSASDIGFGVGPDTVQDIIAKWDGTAWTRLASGLGSANFQSVQAIFEWDDGGGNDLYIGGLFVTSGPNITKWTGSSFSDMDSGVNGIVEVLANHDDGGGDALYVGGSMTTAGALAVVVNRLAGWDGSAWFGLQDTTSGDIGLNSDVLALLDATNLWLGGSFTTTGSGGKALDRVAQWDGANFSEPGDGFATGQVNALAFFSGSVYAGGSFTVTGAPSSTSVLRIARWTGSAWVAVGSGINGEVLSLSVHDDGSGEKLYVGGSFTDAGGVTVNGIASWNGTVWAAVDEQDGVAANRINGISTINTAGASSVRALEVHSGALIAGVSGTAGSSSVGGTYSSGGGPAFLAKGGATP